MKPIFMWAGGKTKMLEKYEPYLPKSFKGYCEPFLGGGAMFIWAYKANPNAKFILNDVNEPIINIYRAIKDDNDKFCSTLDTLSGEYLPLDAPPKPLKKGATQEDKETLAKIKKETKEFEKQHKNGVENDWHKIHELNPTRRSFYFKTRIDYQYHYDKFNSTEEAATLYFLMKTGFNGIWQLKGRANEDRALGRFNTPCGLMNQTIKVYDKDNVLEWHKALQNTTLLTGDFKDAIRHVKEGFYVFMDPPYRGSFADYGTQSDDQFQSDVVEFAHQCRDKGALTLLSNREMDDGFFEERADGDKIVKFDVTYTAGRRKATVDEDGNETFTATKAQEILMIGKTT
mgnify:FL=1